MIPTTTVTEVVNDDGSLTRTRTTVFTQTLTAEQVAAEVAVKQAQLDRLTEELEKSETTLTSVQAKVALKVTPK